MKENYLEHPECHPHYGEVQYDVNGNPICHICGKSFPKLGAHIWNGHRIKMREYCEIFGLDVKHGVCSKEYKNKMRDHVYVHYDTVVTKNLLEKGTKSRFKSGGKGRTKDMMSEQTRKRVADLGRKTGAINIKKTRNYVKHEANEVFSKFEKIVKDNLDEKTVCFIDRGSWSDPQIAIYGKLLNYYDVESLLPEDCNEPTNHDWVSAAMDSYFGYIEGDVHLDDFASEDAMSVVNIIEIKSN